MRELVALLLLYYSKTCLKRSLKIDKTKVLKTNDSLMNVEVLQNAAILLTCIKR